MRKKWLKISVALLVVALAWSGYRQGASRRLRASVEEARRQLREQHFRTDLSDFNFSLSPESDARVQTIISAAQAVRSMRQAHELQLTEAVGTNTALAIAQVVIIETAETTNLWPVLKAEAAEASGALDRACDALRAGSVKFQPTVKPGGYIVVPYLADEKSLARALAVRAVLAMHEHNTNGMLTNLFALSRLVTAWNPEPLDVAHLVRFACQSIASRAIWESVQTDLWNETHLAALQREWESASLFHSLPETAELSCASMTRMCQAAREESYGANLGGWGPVFRDLFRSPARGFRNLWSAIPGYRQHARYRDEGSYEDEKALLLYYRERQEELKQAGTRSTWREMRSLPGATNVMAFKGAKFSRIATILNLKQVALNFQGQGRTLLSQTAEAEAQRRLIVTALALERFVVQHQAYPRALVELVPAFLLSEPVDFMDGQALRYRRLDDGRYLLYSVGLDGVDNGGQTTTPRNLSGRSFRRNGLRYPPHLTADIVWPLPATPAEVDLFERQGKEEETPRPEAIPEL